MTQDNNNLPTIAILGGTGKEGPGLAMRWASVGYKIIIGSRKTDKAERIAAELNNKLGLSSIEGMQNDEAAKNGDICVLTVVHSAHQSALRSLKASLQNKILVDTTARVDFRDPEPPPPPSAGRIAQEILGSDVRVVSALQTIPAHVLKQNLGQDLAADVLVCSDDIKAAEQVINLIESGGMHGYFAGGLDNAIVVEGLASILIGLNRHYNVKTASIGITGV